MQEATKHEDSDEDDDLPPMLTRCCCRPAALAILLLSRVKLRSRSVSWRSSSNACVPIVTAGTVSHTMGYLLQIREVIAAHGIRIYQPPIEIDDEMSADHARILLDAIPFSIIGSTEYVQIPDGRVVKGREYLWGVAEGEHPPGILFSCRDCICTCS